MSTYINTNTTSTMAALNLNANESKLSQYVNELSTGLRINTPADDPAGFVASENMAAQLSGLNAATENSNNAINMVNTADSALNQVQTLLISMRALAVQASNTGTNDSTDIQADQAQIASAIASINQISADTQYGTKNLLDGSSTAAATITPGSAAYTGSSSALSIIQQGSWNSAAGVTGTLQSGTYSNLTVAGATATTFVSSPATNYTSGDYFQGTISINGGSYTIGGSNSNDTLAQLNTAIAGSGYVATINSSNELVLTNSTTGAPATAQTVDFSALSTFANATTATSKGTFAASGTNGSNTTLTAGVTSSAYATVSSLAPTTYTATDSYTGTVVFNGHSFTLTGVTGTNLASTLQSDIQGLGNLTSSGDINYSNFHVTNAAGALTIVDSTTYQKTSAPTLNVSGLTDTTAAAGSLSTTNASTITGTAGAVAGGNTAVAHYNGTWAGTNTFGGSFKLNGTLVSLTGTNNNLAAVNAALSTASLAYTASVDANGNLTFTSNTNGGSAPTADLSTLQAYASGSAIASGGYTNVIAGRAAEASVQLGSAPAVISSATSMNGSTGLFTFSNGLQLQYAGLPTTSGAPIAVSGSITATAGATTYGSNLNFQIGANDGQTTTLSIGSTAASQLGTNTAAYTDSNGNSQTVNTANIAGLNVTSFKGAQDAIAVLNNAISQVSTLRASLGAFQSNVLQSQVTSLGVATTNLQASSSTLTDADMASTVANYTKQQILVSAGTSALAYANQMPQMILKLLQ